jgi:hypothetical protein
MSQQYEIKAEQLINRSNPDEFNFENTKEIKPLEA